MKNKIFFILLIILTLSTVSLFLITFLIERSTINKLSQNQLNEKILERIDYFDEFIEHRKKLLTSLAVNKNFINFIKSKRDKEYIENMYLSYAHSHKEIFQLRYLDLNGNEVIRVDNYKKPVLVKKDQLQNKKSRYYFKDTMKLKHNEYFFSNIDLNIEQGKIEEPYVPTLRIATPIILNNIKYGMVIININISDFLQYLQNSQLHYVNLVYDNGEIIISKYSEYNWSEDLKLDTKIFDLFPNLPKEFYKLKKIQNKEFYIEKLNVNSKNKIYMLLLPKKLEIYDLLYEDLNQNLMFLILLIILFIPISYFLSNYIEDYYQNKISLEGELQKLRVAVEHSPISIVITDKNGLIEYVNPYFTKVTGYSHDQAIGQNPRILKSELTSMLEYEDLWKCLSSKKIWKGTFKNVDKNGKEFWENAIITPIVNEEDKIINYLGIKQEITKEIYLEEELKSKEKMMLAQSRHAAMGEMISMIAHQWRQPLSNISVITSNTLLDIELDSIDKNELKENSEAILKQTNYLSQTIEDFRDFFKPNKEREIITPLKIVEETLDIMGKTLEKSSINVQIVEKSKIHIEIYSRELLQVLINLLKNAQEILEDKKIKDKKILISIFEIEDNVRIEISDNAGGIEESIKDRIFEPYFSTKDEKTGTGLGLYMCKTIVEKHLKGSIYFYNTKEGASFYIDLPIYYD